MSQRSDPMRKKRMLKIEYEKANKAFASKSSMERENGRENLNGFFAEIESEREKKMCVSRSGQLFVLHLNGCLFQTS